MIYTLTLNPSVDYIVHLEEFRLGELNRTVQDSKFPGGKGINVSRVLNNLGVKSKSLGYCGGFTGKFIVDYLNNENIESDFIQVNGDSRINIKLKTGVETEVNANGPAISSENFESLKLKMELLTSEDLLVLAGSIPPSMPGSTYEEIIQIIDRAGAKFIVDAEGDLLKKVIPLRPFLIKPNHIELGEIFGVTISEQEEAITYGKKLVEKGARNVIVSLAGKGAVLITESTAYIANVPNGKVKNSVGAGDSMVAGFIAAYQKTGDLKMAFQFSVASGSATAFSLGLCTKNEIEKLLSDIKIRAVE